MGSPGGRRGKIGDLQLASGEATVHAQSLSQAEPVVAPPSDETKGKRTGGGETVVLSQVDSALRKLLSEEIIELAKQGRGGPKCWPAVLLETAARRSRDPHAPGQSVACLIAQILASPRAAPKEIAMEVARFCQTIVEHTHSIGLGRLHRLRKTVKPFIEQALGLSGEDGTNAATGHLIGRHLTIQQLISRLDPRQPFEIQARAVKVLPDIVNFELRNSLVVEKRPETLHSLGQAVGMVGRTKYFRSLTPKMRDACQSQMTTLQHRIDKASGRG